MIEHYYDLRFLDFDHEDQFETDKRPQYHLELGSDIVQLQVQLKTNLNSIYLIVQYIDFLRVFQA